MTLKSIHRELIILIFASIMFAILSASITGCSQNSNKASDTSVIHVASLKGPTSFGIAALMDDSLVQSNNKYSFDIFTTADEISAKLASKDIDIALIPANVASILYNKTGNITVLDVNTLGVLYLVGSDTQLKSFSGLAGKKVYSTGVGTTPQYVTEYLLEQNMLTGLVDIEYKSTADEVVSYLSGDSASYAILPEPYVTSLMSKNPKIHRLISLEDEWKKLDCGNICTGVTVVRSEFLKDHKQQIVEFIKDHAQSVKLCKEKPQDIASIVANQGIVASENIALNAMPNSNIVALNGQDMQDILEPYLMFLLTSNSDSIGAKLPNDDFYFKETK